MILTPFVEFLCAVPKALRYCCCEELPEDDCVEEISLGGVVKARLYEFAMFKGQMTYFINVILPDYEDHEICSVHSEDLDDLIAILQEAKQEIHHREVLAMLDE